MKKVLIISFYYPPARGAASERPESWFTYFPDKNLHPVILTRNWTGNEKAWSDFVVYPSITDTTHIEEKDRTYISVPYKPRNWYAKMHVTSPWKYRPFRNLIAMLGRFRYRDQWNIKLNGFAEAINEILRNQTVDAVLITLPPQQFLHVIPVIKKQVSVPVVVDFRDLWSNEILQKKTSEILTLSADEKRTIRLLSMANGATVVSSPMAEHVRRIGFKNPVEVVYNGFEERYFVNPIPLSPVFTITILGYIYPQQDVSLMIEAFKQLLEKIPEMHIRFVGAKSLGSTFTVFQKAFEKYPNRVHFTERVSRSEAMDYLRQSAVLFYPGWKGYKGVVSTKIFDYMASGLPVIIAPGDDDIIDDLTQKSLCGSVQNTVGGVITEVEKLFEQWKRGEKPDNRNVEFINLFSRRNQAYKMADFIHHIIKQNGK